ncbi:MAG TPA: [Fe-Fe] hydrogenase large subunit C-terminal domain-containing protein [Phycisphaerae bacterium]|nr:[Fe-Fe] hydrogenase large subunit C-terminal domain-containing protein [Phycisphaerae bacterium]
MKHAADIPLITTIKERCRVCYTCVRECPAKAIRISDGQAEVLPQRCVGCGNCVRVCSQHAKQMLSSIEQVQELLADPGRVAACLAPSFPAEFDDVEYHRLVGMIRALGFDLVTEVSFGADLVADRYRKLLMESNGKRYIETCCPAIVAFVERYHPNLVDALAPLVSPMVAQARALRKLYGDDLKVVFIGPCIAKKGEAASRTVDGDVDAVLTFVELRQMFVMNGITPISVEGCNFDPPHGAAGALFPISRGMLQAADITEDLATGDVVSASGRSSFVEAIKEFEAGDLDAKLLEVLCCDGCIMGPGMRSQSPLFNRRSCVSHFVRRRLANLDRGRFRGDMEYLSTLDLGRSFSPDDQRVAAPSEEQLRQILNRFGKIEPEDELNCGACGYETCREHAVAIYKGLAEKEMCLPYTIDRLRQTVSDLARSNADLASTQEALSQSEKLASMGQLAAGIAHEVNNPLGVVIMFAHLLLEDLPAADKRREDLITIVENADRCKKIVSGLLHFARQNKVAPAPTDLRELVDDVVKTTVVPSNVILKAEHECGAREAEIDRDQIAQVLTNLISNALAAMPDGGPLTIRTGGDEHNVRIAVADTGIGIPEENRASIFTPFFTTKPVGKGTGLGLAVTYGIVKMHRGQIEVASNANPAKGPTGTTFTVILPRKSQKG